MKQWKRLAALSSAIVMAAATLTYFPNDTLQNIRLELSASANETGAVETSAAMWTKTESDGLTWTLDYDGKLTISGTGAMKDYDYDNNQSPVCKNWDVRKVVIEDGVTSIGDDAFGSCTNLTDITIPDSVTSIGNHAFSGCSSLTSVTIPNSVTSIGEYAFSECSRLTNITIPGSVTSIGSYAFSECSRLTSITISYGVTSIGNSAFSYCRSLTSITIPGSVTSIGNSAFDSCKKLKTISLGCGSALKKSDFGKQANLVSYASHTLKKTAAKAKTCTEDGNKEYWTCEHCGKYFLSDDANPATATAVEQSEFIIPALNHKNATTRGASEPTETAPGYSGDLYCPDCNTVLEKGYTYWNEGDLTWKLYEDGTLTISGTGAMKDYNSDDNRSPVFWNTDVTSIVIEEGVTSIGNNAFYDCDSLTSVTIPGNVESIGERAFYHCDNLTDVTLQDGVKSIGRSAFIWCNNLTNIVLSNSITSIGGYAFKDCTSLTSITIPDGVPSIGDWTFYNCSSLTSIKIPDSVTRIGKDAFKNCSSLQTISLGCGSALKKSNFGDKADLVSYTNQHLLTKTAAKAATCSESGNKEYWTCEHCGKYFLSDDTNPETAKAVEQSETIIPASHKLTKVKEEKAPTCTEDGNKEYWTCEHCGKYFLSDDANPETAKAVELSETITPALNHKNATTRGVAEPTETAPGYSGDLYCPDCDTVLEKGYTYWNEGNLTWKLDADGTLTISGTGAMKNYNDTDKLSPACRNSSVKKVVIEDGVTSIGDYAFYNYTSLTSITIPDSVTSIGNFAFSFCWYLTSITIPDSVTSIGNNAFVSCIRLTSITIPDSVTSIGTGAFYGCNSLTSITIPDSVTSIGTEVFQKCTRLKTISLSCGSALKKSDFGGEADLVSYTNQHLLTKTAAKAVTCTENGNKEYWTCEHCGKYFLSDDTNPETAKAVEQSETIIPALKHKNATTRGAVEPNGTKPGYSGDRYCPDCDTVLEKGYTYWNEGNLTWKLYDDGTLNISGTGAMKDYADYLSDGNRSPVDNNSKIKKVVIEKGVTSIGNYAFSRCWGLKSITIPDGVTSIGDHAFDSCINLRSITLPDSITSIGIWAFYNCWNVPSIIIPDGVTSIEDFTFDSCIGLTSITIPNSVTNIKSSAFHNCADLTSITIPDSVTSIGDSAFSDCNSLTTISLSCGSALKKSDFGKQADLVSYTNQHLLTKTEAKAKTCTEDGNKEYWTCEHCGKYFLSDDTNPETAKAVEQSEFIIPASHKPQADKGGSERCDLC